MFHSLLIHPQLISPIVLTYLDQVHFVVLYISVLINIYVLQILLLSIKRLLKWQVLTWPSLGFFQSRTFHTSGVIVWVVVRVVSLDIPYLSSLQAVTHFCHFSVVNITALMHISFSLIWFPCSICSRLNLYLPCSERWQRCGLNGAVQWPKSVIQKHNDI